MSEIINNAFEEIDPVSEQFVKNNTDIIEEICRIIEDKGLTQKDFAVLMDKNESEVSKWLSGVHNLTLRSISKMEVALDQDIIMTCSDAKKKFEKISYVHIGMNATPNLDFRFTESDIPSSYSKEVGKTRKIA